MRICWQGVDASLWVGLRSCGVGGEYAVEDGVPGAALGVGAGASAHGCMGGGIVEDGGDGGGEVFVVGDAAGGDRRGALGAAGFGGLSG